MTRFLGDFLVRVTIYYQDESNKSMLVNLETLKYKENKDCVALHFHIGRLCTKFESIYGSEYIVTDKEIKINKKDDLVKENTYCHYLRCDVALMGGSMRTRIVCR